MNANVLSLATDVCEILHPLLQRRVLKVKHCRVMSLLSSSRVYWSKHRQIYLSQPDLHKDIDLTVYMDVESNPGPTECENTSRSMNRTKICSNQGNINIVHLNIRSLKNKEHYLLAKDLVLKQKFDVFTISETSLDKSITNSEIEFPRYSLHGLDRDGKRGGGVCAYVNQNVKCKPMKELSYIAESGLHQLWLKIQVANFRSFDICTT